MPPASGLSIQQQSDWGAGEFPEMDRRLIPQNGAASIDNGLVAENAGLFQRGGSKVMGSPGFSSVGGRWIWSAQLLPGQRTIFADNSGFGVLGADDATPIRLPLPTLEDGVSTFPMPGDPAWQAGEIGSMVWISVGNNRPLVYGGSQKSASYSVGNISSSDDDIVTGAQGTAWLANVDPGMILRRPGNKSLFVVQEVQADNKLRLDRKWDAGTGSYKLSPLDVADSTKYVSKKRRAEIEALGAVGKRLLISDGERVWFSKYGKPHEWADDDYHKIPRGVRMIGIADARGVALLFTTRGVWGIYDLEKSLVDPGTGDPQQRLQLITGDVILWSAAGLTDWQGGIIAPSLDGIWIIYSGLLREQGPQRLSTSVDRKLARYIDAGYQPGKATVFRNHYFLPIRDAAYNHIDTLVCRLDRPQRTAFGTVFPFTHLSGQGAAMNGYARRVGAVAPATNYAPDPDFAHDTIGAAAASWQAVSPTNFTLNKFVVDLRKKARGLHFKGTKGSGDSSFDANLVNATTGRIATAVGQSWTIGVRLEVTDTSSDGVRVGLAWYDAGGTKLSESLGANNKKSGSLTLDVSGAAPASAASFVPFVRQDMNSGAKAEWWVRQALVLKGTFDAPFSNPGFRSGDTAGYQWAGTPGNSISTPKTTVDYSRRPMLLGIEAAPDARVVDCTSYFEPSEDVALDHDGAEFNLELEQRDVAMAPNEGKSTAKKAEVRYHMESPNGDVPEIRLSYVADDDDNEVALDPAGRPDTGGQPMSARIGKDRRYIRLIVRSSGPVAKLYVKTVGLFVRQKSMYR